MSGHEKLGNETRVFNLDETNTMTGKVLAAKQKKQMSTVISTKRGKLVTTCYIVSAPPPVTISNTIRLNELFVNNREHFIID